MHAQVNPVERTNRTLKTMIISFIEEKHNEWDKHLYELMFAYNTLIHESTGKTPAFLIDRHPARLKKNVCGMSASYSDEIVMKIEV